jgi:S-adenosyl-L-methionine hydrolase (adenosine-forming)
MSAEPAYEYKTAVFHIRPGDLLMRVVTLLSDFGLRDGYVAQMKGTILDNCPSAIITDISHDIERQNIPMGSFILETTAPYFPRDTIHVAVVDPGVGSARKAIVVECETGIFIGPDNGLIARTSEKLGLKSIHEIREKEFHRTPVSTTFQGRDLFAYTAGLIASGRRPGEVGPKVSNLETLDLSLPKLAGKRLTCQVLHVDAFGNVITNVGEELVGRLPKKVGENVEIEFATRKLHARYARSYYEVDKDAMAVLLGSQGFLEIAVREGSARDKLNVKSLDILELRF